MPFLFKAFGEFKLPVYVYAEVPFMALLGRTELAVRLTTVCIGTATIVTTYLLTWEIFRRQLTALAAAAFLAILPWHFHYSRTGLGDIVCFPFFLTIALYLFLRAMRQEKPPFAAAVAFGLTFYTYRAAWVIVPPLLVVLVLLYHRELLAHWREALYCAGIILVLLLPIGRHLLSSSSDRTSEAWIFDLHNGHSILHNFWEFYKSHFTESYLFSKADNGPITRHYLPGHGVLYYFMAPLIVAGIGSLLVKPNQRYALMLALLILFPLAAAVSTDSPHSSRAFLGSVVFASLAAAGVGFGVETALKVRRPAGMVLATGFVLVVVGLAAFSFASYLRTYFDDYPALSAGYWGWQDGPQAILSQFTAEQDRYDEMYLDGTFNAPGIFIPFYTHDKCPKCRIGDSEAYDPSKRQLFALRPDSLKPDAYVYVKKGEIVFPGDQLGFVLVEISRRR